MALKVPNRCRIIDKVIDAAAKLTPAIMRDPIGLRCSNVFKEQIAQSVWCADLEY